MSIPSPERFRKVLLIPGHAGPQRFRPDDWQRADFEAMDGAWQSIVTGSVPAKSRFWLERPRGHSKTMDIAIAASWALAFASHPIQGIAASGDKDQAKLLRDSINLLCTYNSWLADLLEVQAFRVVNRTTGSTLEILASDAPTSYGQTPSFIIIDELTHWPKRDLFDSLFSSAAKRENCVVVAIMNAGFDGDWQQTLREQVRQDRDWYFSRLDGPAASWISRKALDEQRRLLPSVAFARLWENCWTSGASDALSADTIDAAVDPKLTPMQSASPDFVYAAGLDLGVSRDHAAICIVAKQVGHSERVKTNMVRMGEWGPEPIYETVQHPGDGRVRLACTRTWAPPRGGKIDLPAVEEAIADLHKRFGFSVCNFDPWQAEHMAQRLRRRGVPMREITFQATNLQGMASTLLEAFNSGQVVLYPDANLVPQLKRLRVVEKSYGFRLESPRDATGHGDLATAFNLALLATPDIGPRKRSIRDWLDVGAF